MDIEWGQDVNGRATRLEREQKRQLEQAGEDEAGRLNQVLQDRVDALEHLLAWSLSHPLRVDFAAMKLPLPQFRPGPLVDPLPVPDPETFKPKPLTRLTRLVPGAEERFLVRWEQGRLAYEQAWSRWQHDEHQRQAQLAMAQQDHKTATAAAQEQHQRIDELEADFRTGRRAAVEQCLTAPCRPASTRPASPTPSP